MCSLDHTHTTPTFSQNDVVFWISGMSTSKGRMVFLFVCSMMMNWEDNIFADLSADSDSLSPENADEEEEQFDLPPKPTSNLLLH